MCSRLPGRRTHPRPDFLKEAQRTLRARGLLVGIPRRGRLLCIDGELPAEAVKVFGFAVTQEFVSGESAEISPMLFAVKNGAIVDLVESVADALPPELQRQECEAPEDGNAPYVTAVTVRNDHGTAPPSRDEKDKPFWEHNPGPLAGSGSSSAPA